MLEKLVTSLEVSKRLKELGVEQLSCFYWKYSPTGKKWIIIEGSEGHSDEDPIKQKFYISAFTCTELAAMMDATTFPTDPGFAGEYVAQKIEYKHVSVDYINANLRRFWEVK